MNFKTFGSTVKKILLAAPIEKPAVAPIWNTISDACDMRQTFGSMWPFELLKLCKPG